MLIYDFLCRQVLMDELILYAILVSEHILVKKNKLALLLILGLCIGISIS